MSSNKPRIVKDFEKLDDDVQEQIKLAYPEGFHQNLISYTDKEGQRRSALPFETEDKYYLVRMSVVEAKQIIEDDDDYDDDGNLKSDVQEEYENKHDDDEGGDDFDDEDED